MKKSLPQYFRFIRMRKIVLIFILLITNLITFGGAYFFVQKLDVENFRQTYPLLDPMRFFAEPRDLLTTVQPIREELRAIFEKEGLDSTSLYFEYINTGANISLNSDIRILPASLIKVPLAMAVMKKIERGDWQLYNELVMTKEDRDAGWGDVYMKYPVGSPITIQSLLEEMLLSSDNTAYRILYRNLSLDEVRDVFISLGLDDFFDQEGKVTAKEYTRLIRSLYTANYLTPEHSQLLLDILSRTEYDDYLGQGIPDDAFFAHKIGENESKTVILDAGLVYIGNRVYLISMAIDYEQEGISRDKSLEIFERVSSLVYNYISSANNETL
ncbi:serine hydrolase [Candidatus Gracilibacteria bacterium]|nr:serine hydrolase [Candidatus Gracilibacteria bacterium]